MVIDTDIRETLYNETATGPAYQVQLPTERITTLRGILFDFDPGLLIPGNPIFPPADNPEDFYRGIQSVLDRHPLTRHGEVRASGTGLHVIVWLDPPVVLTTAAEQQHWAAAVRAVQCSLPIDPDMPGITAMTRPLGATNSKCGAVVKQLKPGTSIDPQEVLDYLERLQEAYFQEIATVLLGRTRVQPCPVCGGAGTRLDILKWIGKCYGGCSRVQLDQLYDVILKPLDPSVKKAAAQCAEDNQAERSAGKKEPACTDA